MLIRPENNDDHAAIHDVVAAAFETPAEARLVDALRDQARPILSLVAELDRHIVGHILFSPVTLDDHPDIPIMGLAPMAVAPAHQRKGIGKALVNASLHQLRETPCAAVVVLGHPEYYPRFGFVPAPRFRLKCAYDVPDDVFMAMELHAGALDGIQGLISYHAAFSEV